MISSSTPPRISEYEENIDMLQVWREMIFNNTIKAVAVLGSVAYFIGIAAAYKDLTTGYFIGYTVAYLWVIATAFITRIPTTYRAFSFTLMVLSLGILSAFERGAIGDGRIWLLLATAFAAILLGRRAGLGFAIASTLIWVSAGYFFISSPASQPNLEEFTLGIWGGTTITYLIAGLGIVLSVSALLSNLSQTIEESSSLAKKSKAQNKVLEIQRQALERRSNTLEISAKISRKLASITTYEDTLKQTPNLLRTEFDLTSAAVFLLDTDNVLRLASHSGWNEQAHPASGYHLSLDEDFVGLAIIGKEAQSNKKSGVSLQSIMPKTQSYAAIPLRGRDKILGALVLQCATPDSFGDEMLSILQIFADQVALLFENANLLIQKESALDAERRAYGKITQRAWDDSLESQNYGIYRRDEKGLFVLPSKPYRPQEKQIEAEHIPIKIRGKVIGHIDAHKPKDRAWTASEKELLRILGSRLEAAMDSARLYEDTQDRAERELIISETSARIRETLDIEAVLATAASELRDVLNAAEVDVWISPEQEA